MAPTILAVGLLYFAGHLLTHFFERSKIPDVLLLIIIGIVARLTGLISVDEIGPAGNVFTQFALIIILFEGGLDIELASFVRSARRSVIMTTAFFAISAATIACILHFGFNFSTMASAATGFICGGTSSAVVIPMLSMIRASKKVSAMLVIESALTDVLCIVFTIGVVQSSLSGEFKIGSIIFSLVSSLVMASLIGVLTGILWLRCINWIKTFSNTQFATCFAMFIVYGLTELAGFSGAIAALAFGIVIGNARIIARKLYKMYLTSTPVGVLSDPEKKLYKELAFLVKIFFFLYLGISIPFESVDITIIALTLVVALFALRPWCALLLTGRKLLAHDKTITAVMLPKGLAAAVLAGLPGQYGMAEGASIQAITYHVVLYSIIITSILIPLVERTCMGSFLDRLYSHSSEPNPQTPPTNA